MRSQDRALHCSASRGKNAHGKEEECIDVEGAPAACMCQPPIKCQ